MAANVDLPRGSESAEGPCGGGGARLRSWRRPLVVRNVQTASWFSSAELPERLVSNQEVCLCANRGRKLRSVEFMGGVEFAQTLQD